MSFVLCLPVKSRMQISWVFLTLSLYDEQWTRMRCDLRGDVLDAHVERPESFDLVDCNDVPLDCVGTSHLTRFPVLRSAKNMGIRCNVALG